MGSSFNPALSTADLSDKVVFLTGGTNGIGRSTIAHLLSLPLPPAKVYFTGRSAQRAADIVSLSTGATQLVFLPMDMTSLGSVKEAAGTFLQRENKVDILIVNAGTMDEPPSLTQDGYEVQFGVNYLSHALLFSLLERAIVHAPARARVVVVCSEGYALHPRGGILFDELKNPQCAGGKGTMGGLVRYAQSKLAQIVWGQEVSRRFPQLDVVTLHPGQVATPLTARLGFLLKVMVFITNPFGLATPSQGALNTVWAATSDEIHSGSYYMPVGIEKTKMATNAPGDEALASRLWDWTEEELKRFL